MSCGGKEEQQVNVAAPLPPVTSPVVVEKPQWKEVYRFEWTASTTFGGWVGHNMLQCDGPTDPDKRAGGTSGPVADWAVLGSVVGTLQVKDGLLLINSYQHTNGYALLSHKVWDNTKPMAISTTVKVEADVNAWLGITIIADETDYRELAVYEWNGSMLVGVWKPCTIEHSVGVLTSNTHSIRIEYTPPPSDVCWTHYVDGNIVSTEKCSVLGSPLVGPARVGIYVVNLQAESKNIPGYVRATVGPIVVEQQ